MEYMKHDIEKNPPHPLKYPRYAASDPTRYSKNERNETSFNPQQTDHISHSSHVNHPITTTHEIPYTSTQSYLDSSSSFKQYNSMNNPPSFDPLPHLILIAPCITQRL